MPVASKHARLGRVHIGHQDVENSSGLQPLGDPCHDLARLIEMLEHVKAGDHVEVFTRKACVQNIPGIYLRSTPRLGGSRGLSGHLESVQLQDSLRMNSRNDPELHPKSSNAPDCLYCVSVALRSLQRWGEFWPPAEMSW